MQELTTPETANLLKTLSTQLPVEVLRQQQMEEYEVAQAAMGGIDEFERMHPGLAGKDDDDDDD